MQDYLKSRDQSYLVSILFGSTYNEVLDAGMFPEWISK